MSAKSATTFWRLAGLTYLEFSATATTALRQSLKEPARAKAMTRNVVSYNRAVFTEGVPGVKKPVRSLADSAHIH